MSGLDGGEAESFVSQGPFSQMFLLFTVRSFLLQLSLVNPDDEVQDKIVFLFKCRPSQRELCASWFPLSSLCESPAAAFGAFAVGFYC